MFGKYLYLIVLACILISSVANCASGNVRPVKLTILDSLTQKPIPNLPVYYCVETYYLKKILFVIPIHDPIHYKEKVKMFFVTNENGEVKIDLPPIRMHLYEGIYSEHITVNIDIKSEYVNKNKKVDSFFKYFNIHDFKNTEKFFNPNSHYKGFLIFSTKNILLEENERSGTKRKIFNVLWNSNGLAKTEETFVIELERWQETL
jgi:hypothetical protein